MVRKIKFRHDMDASCLNIFVIIHLIKIKNTKC